STVNNYLRLLKLPVKVQAGLRDKTISMGHARAIVGLEDDKMMVKVFEKTVLESLSVRKVEELIRSFNQKGEPSISHQKKLSVLKSEHLDLQEHLAGWFGTKVLIKADAKSKGEIKIPFKTNEELEDILSRLRKN
ncbi:MAG: ParB family chromosome partitioning protein, partial [Arcticibacterium sp.]